MHINAHALTNNIVIQLQLRTYIQLQMSLCCFEFNRTALEFIISCFVLNEKFYFFISIFYINYKILYKRASVVKFLPVGDLSHI